LASLISVPIHPSTGYYGELFEQYIILEISRLVSYYEVQYRMSYLLTASGVEIDLIIERPGKTTLVLEIKSSKHVPQSELSNLVAIAKEITNAEAICLYDGTDTLRYNEVDVVPWRVGISQRVFEHINQEH
jgi:hypothetical protein